MKKTSSRMTLLVIGVIVALPLSAQAGPAAGGTDSDLDGVEDAFDNCTAVSNADQADGNHDGCGDACTVPITCDATGDTIVGVPDFLIYSDEFGNDCNSSPSLTCVSDCTGDNIVGIPDFLDLSFEFGNKVGPSGITTTQCNPETCICTPQ